MNMKRVILTMLFGSITVASTYAQGRPVRPPQGGVGAPTTQPTGTTPGQPNPPQPANPGTTTAPNAPPAPAAPATGFGAPLSGLTAAELAAFNAGRADFFFNETPQSGLGPIFNDRSCVICHQNPSAGGSNGAPNSFVTLFGSNSGGVFDPLINLGGSLLQARAINPNVLEIVPASANVRARRMTTPIFGAGLIEAIPDATIRTLETQTKPDGVRGRAATIVDVASGQTRVGRFGWKAQQATLLAFSADAYLNEMGITNRLFPTENAPNGNVTLLNQYNTQVTIVGVQATANPATGRSKVDRVADFMRFLGPPPAPALNGSATAGQALFGTIGCAVCHTPTLQTGPNPITALNNKSVRLYSDLLLHDMGPLNDGIAQGNASAREMKTAPLWGLRSRPVWLHDGRARTIEAAVNAHAGEAATSRTRFQGLSNQQRRQLLDFLNSI